MGKRSCLLFLLCRLFLLAASAVATVHDIQIGNFFFNPTKTVVSPATRFAGR